MNAQSHMGHLLKEAMTLSANRTLHRVVLQMLCETLLLESVQGTLRLAVITSSAKVSSRKRWIKSHCDVSDTCGGSVLIGSAGLVEFYRNDAASTLPRILMNLLFLLVNAATWVSRRWCVEVSVVRSERHHRSAQFSRVTACIMVA